MESQLDCLSVCRSQLDYWRRVIWIGQGTVYLNRVPYLHILYLVSTQLVQYLRILCLYFVLKVVFVSFVSTVGPQYICVHVKSKQGVSSPASKLIFDD